MTRPAMVYDVLIASPSDVREERDAVESAILEWNAMNTQLGIVLRPVRWERDSLPLVGKPPQEALNDEFVKDCDLGIAFFWSRVGTPTANALSGTVEEVELLLKLDKPVLLYFAQRPAQADADGEQLARLKEFQQDIQKRAVYDIYDHPADLRSRVIRHLGKLIPRMYENFGQVAFAQVTATAKIPIEAVAEPQGTPEFRVSLVAAHRLANHFTPEFKVAQISGASIPSFEWRLNALGKVCDWRVVNTGDLERTHFVQGLDLSDGMPVAVGDMFFMLRFAWHGRWFHQRHRWPLTKLTHVGKALFDIGDEKLPPLYWAAEQPMEAPS